MEEKIKALTELFRETAMAHHEAFKATDGDDPAWPLWYAEYLFDKLTPDLGEKLAKNTLIYDLMRLDQEVKSGASGEDWAVDYAQSLLNKAS